MWMVGKVLPVVASFAVVFIITTILWYVKSNAVYPQHLGILLSIAHRAAATHPITDVAVDGWGGYRATRLSLSRRTSPSCQVCRGRH